MLFKFHSVLVLALAAPRLLPAAIIGTNTPALPLTAQRIAALPAEQQPPWKKYLEDSERQLRVDRAFLLDEMKRSGLKQPLLPPPGRSGSGLSTPQPSAWFGQPDGLRIADIVLSFQTPAGGWSKNLDMTRHLRSPGEHFAGNNLSLHPDNSDYDLPQDLGWNYVGTFDNSATTTQLRFLAKVIVAVGTDTGARYRAAFLKGLSYIFAAQLPNGGWPQVWPLEGGYHDAITFNDNAFINVLELCSQAAQGKEEFAFMPPRDRALAAASVQRGIECVLNTQIVANGRSTAWCQQHDALNFKPCSARNYEMPAQAASESADVMTFLMRLPNPNPRIVAAVHAAAAWFEKTGLRDVEFRTTSEEGRQLASAPGKGPIWARYCEIGTDRPIFGDRDKTIHDTVNEISRERRNRYSWFSEKPAAALKEYGLWSKAHPRDKPQTTRIPAKPDQY